MSEIRKPIIGAVAGYAVRSCGQGVEARLMTALCVTSFPCSEIHFYSFPLSLDLDLHNHCSNCPSSLLNALCRSGERYCSLPPVSALPFLVSASSFVRWAAAASSLCSATSSSAPRPPPSPSPRSRSASSPAPAELSDSPTSSARLAPWIWSSPAGGSPGFKPPNGV